MALLSEELENWQLCMVAKLGDEQTTWNGICHLPTWTVFKIEGDQSEIVSQAKPLGPDAERLLKEQAVTWFYSGWVSTHPPAGSVARPKNRWGWRSCRPRQPN
jgi:hypothetical protein